VFLFIGPGGQSDVGLFRDASFLEGIHIFSIMKFNAPLCSGCD
jgi:hypothetical protein